MPDDNEILRLSPLGRLWAFFKKIFHYLFIFGTVWVILTIIVGLFAVVFPDSFRNETGNKLCVDLSVLKSTLTYSKDNSHSIIENTNLLEEISKNLSGPENQAAKQQIDSIAATIRTKAGDVQAKSESYLETIERDQGGNQDGKKPQTDGLLDQNFIASAFAETSPPLSNSFLPFLKEENLRPTITIIVLIAIIVFWLICIALFCFTKDQEKLKFADNMIRTIIGFFIGIVTGFFGFPK